MYNYIIVGCGYAGAVSARMLAEKGNKVLVLDKRNHISGNMYDEYNEVGILVHKYGPHILVMNSEKCFNFLSKFTEWIGYEHTVNAEVNGREVPLPINLNSIDILFDKNKADVIKAVLLDEYGANSLVPILQMKNSSNNVIKEFSDYIYENIFFHYTRKMWNLNPEEIDMSVTGRIPVRISYDNRHFLHQIQVMPKYGYNELFSNMLKHDNIHVQLNTKANEILEFENNKISYLSKDYSGKVIYTGSIDELLGYKYGVMPYRSLYFEFENHPIDYIQSSSVLNWPDSRPATRRTEMKRLVQQKKDNITTTITEYPGEYNKNSDKFFEPYYPINSEYCNSIYEKYKNDLKGYKNLILVGRLADYKYYNMEATILRTMEVVESI